MSVTPSLQPRRVVVVDYGMGNLRSVAQALSKVAPKGVQVLIESQPKAILEASHVVLPGQGAMPDCMRAMRASGLLEAVLHAASSKPLLGICVGQQMLLQTSEEGPTDSLGLFAGDVVRFPAEHTTEKGLKVPHMGWNQVEQTAQHPLWAGIPNFAWFYFVHSYYCRPVNAAHSVASSMHGLPFTCAIARDNIFATQFHPEKSAHCGLRLYQNFLNWHP